MTVPILDSDSLERLLMAMHESQNAQGLRLALSPEQVFSSEVVLQLRGCGFLRDTFKMCGGAG